MCERVCSRFAVRSATRVQRAGNAAASVAASPTGRRLKAPHNFTARAPMVSPRTFRRSLRGTCLCMDKNPPFPSPEELKAKLSEFMKSNFGDKVSFATFAQPETAEAGGD